MRLSLCAFGLLASIAATSALPVDSFNFHDDAVKTTTTTTHHPTTTSSHHSTATQTKTSSSATAHPTAAPGKEVAIKSQTDFCLFLPPHPGNDVATTEDFGVLYCAKGAAGAPGAKTFPSGFITTAHYAKSSTYIQVTGYLDRTKYSLKASDEGGQYDNHGNGKPTGAQCKGYNYFVSLIEPANDRFCIRCCQNKVDCNTGRSGYGCERVVPGDYSQSSSHGNTDFSSVLDEINYSHINVIEPPTNNTANSPLLAFPNEIVKLETLYDGAPTADQFKTEWVAFITQLKASYPNNVADIEALDNATANINDTAGWEQFIELLKTKVDSYLYGNSNSGDDSTSSDPTTADPTISTDTSDSHSNEWHENDDTTTGTDPSTDPFSDPSSGDDTSGGNDTTTDPTTDPTTNGNSTTTDGNTSGSDTSGSASDSSNDYVTLKDLDNELNSKLDAFSSKILSDIQDLLKQNGFTASSNAAPTTPTSAHNNQATW
ncbi:hypothetical protein Unana1_04743 [Umbelopsis nana]